MEGMPMRRPAAVVTRASETPSARSMGRVAAMSLATTLNERIMPRTVPKRPSIGAIAPISAR